MVPRRREIVKGLRAYNVAAVGKPDHRPLTVTIRERGKIVGGLVGETYFGWMFVGLLWVSEKHRGKGWGTSLMRGRRSGGAQSRRAQRVSGQLQFPGPAFYAKLGYREFGRLKEFPPGYDRVWMTKAL